MQQPSWTLSTPSVDRFDPTALRCEVLRRAAQEASLRLGGDLGGPFAPSRPPVRRPDPPQGTNASAPAATVAPSSLAAGATQLPPEAMAPSDAPAAPATPVVTMATSVVGECVSTVSMSRALLLEGLQFIRKSLAKWTQEAKLSVFLAFPGDSLFRDPSVEEMYQRHHMHQWSPRFEWSSVAWLQMLVWDLVANPRYRLPLVGHFYTAFVALVFIHASLFMALRGSHHRWRISRGILLCSFFVGRGVVCHPQFIAGVPESEAQLAALTIHAATSLIGIGMTNLSGVLALQLHTLDTLLLCVAHGFAWLLVTIHIPSGEGWQTLLAGHSLVAFVCVWQQREQERFDRNCFEEELLMERGMLLRSADCLVRRGTEADFTSSMKLLHRARSAEHIHF